MNKTQTAPRVWPAVLVETARYWLRRYGTMVLIVAAATAIATVMAVTGATDKAEQIIAGIAFYAPFISGLLVMGGIVSDERESGLIVLWFQKPASLIRSYTIRYLLNLTLLASLAIALGIIVAGIAVTSGLLSPARGIRLGLVTVPIALIPAAMVFALSAWGVRRDSTVAFFLIFAGLSVTALTALDTGMAARTIKTVSFPIDSIMAIAGGAAYPPDLTRPLLTILTQLAAWTGLGLLGLLYTQRALARGG